MDIGTLTSTVGSAGSSAARASVSDTFDTFLTLLTTQLQYQDPIDPLNTDKFTNQLVQFSQVEQQIASNDKLDALLGQGGFNQISFAASLTGKSAEFRGSELSYDGSTPLQYGYRMPAGVDSATINIRNARGTLIHAATGDTTAGRHPFTWSGETLDGSTALPGIYSIEVVAQDSDGNPIAVETSVARRVTGVDLSGTGILVETAEGAFDMNDIIAIRDRDISAEVLGVNLLRFKLLSFGISSFYAGCAGSLWAYFFKVVTPESFPLEALPVGAAQRGLDQRALESR